MGFDKAGIRMRKRGTTAILEGTNEAVSLGLKNLIMEGDSLEVINWISVGKGSFLSTG